MNLPCLQAVRLSSGTRLAQGIADCVSLLLNLSVHSHPAHFAVNRTRQGRGPLRINWPWLRPGKVQKIFPAYPFQEIAGQRQARHGRPPCFGARQCQKLPDGLHPRGRLGRRVKRLPGRHADVVGAKLDAPRIAPEKAARREERGKA